MSDDWADLSGPEREAWLRGGKLYEVLDSYGIPVFTGTLNECGVWIDPVLGIDFEGAMWGKDHEGGSIDADRFTLQDDGSFVVRMYEGPGGIGGEMIVRPKEAL